MVFRDAVMEAPSTATMRAFYGGALELPVVAESDEEVAVRAGATNEDLYVGGRTSGAFPGFTNAGGTDGFVAKILRGE